MNLTGSQKEALVWLLERGGSAVRWKANVYMSEGLIAPFQFTTWNKLRTLGYVTFDRGTRLELTEPGRIEADRLRSQGVKPDMTMADKGAYGDD